MIKALKIKIPFVSNKTYVILFRKNYLLQKNDIQSDSTKFQKLLID